MIETLKSLLLVYRLVLAVSFALLGFAFASKKGPDIDAFEQELDRLASWTSWEGVAGPDHVELNEPCRLFESLAPASMTASVTRELRGLGIETVFSTVTGLENLRMASPNWSEMYLVSWKAVRTGAQRSCTSKHLLLPPTFATQVSGLASRNARVESVEVSENKMSLVYTTTNTAGNQSIQLGLIDGEHPGFLDAKSPVADLWRSVSSDAGLWDDIKNHLPRDAAGPARTHATQGAKEVNLGGIPISSNVAVAGGPVALLLLMIDLLVHAKHLLTYARRAERKELNEAAAFPLTPTMDGTLARYATCFSLVALPSGATAAVLVSGSALTAQAWFGVCCMTATAILAVVSVRPAFDDLREFYSTNTSAPTPYLDPKNPEPAKAPVSLGPT